MINTWYADTSQVKDMDEFVKEIRVFFGKAYEHEKAVINQVKFYDGIFEELREVKE